MHICVFEDQDVAFLEPLTLSRPAFDLCTGAYSLLHRQQGYFSARESGALVRSPLEELCRLAHPDLAVNDAAWLRSDPILVNARWMPPAGADDELTSPRIGLVGDQVAYVIPPAHEGLRDASPLGLHDSLERWRLALPRTPAGGRMIDYPWDLVELNAALLALDFPDGAASPAAAQVMVVGPRERLLVDPSAVIEPAVVADTSRGPVVIAAEAHVQAFSRLEGPCYIGPRSWVVGGKIRGSTIGPMCRIGGEVEASIVHAYSNKYHDGFLGHSYVGEWVNLAAGTQVSDLRNDYGAISVTIAGESINTGQTKVGAFIGDHTKTGLNTLINTGSAIGAFCNLLPSSTLLPRVIPSFCAFRHGQVQERPDLRQAFATAAIVMQRRGCQWTTTHESFSLALYDSTTIQRRHVIRESEQRRLRRIV